VRANFQRLSPSEGQWLERRRADPAADDALAEIARQALAAPVAVLMGLFMPRFRR
jgi:hypothetical protein